MSVNVIRIFENDALLSRSDERLREGERKEVSTQRKFLFVGSTVLSGVPKLTNAVTLRHVGCVKTTVSN
jgi:hypothetical protein